MYIHEISTSESSPRSMIGVVPNHGADLWLIEKIVGLYIVDDLCWRFVGIEMLAGCVVWGARSYMSG